MNGIHLPRATVDLRTKKAMRMLMPENLALIRCQELRVEAQRHREFRRVRKGRRWRRLADFAASRADRHAC